MRWEHLTSPEFEKAVGDVEGVCLLAVGCLEKHGDHLPIGQDTLYSHELCCRAAEEEAAMVFPQYYFGQIHEARHVPGTVALAYDLIIPVLESMCDEIARNGLKKILIVSGHGGNSGTLEHFRRLLQAKEKDYSVFITAPHEAEKVGLMTAEIDGHGGEEETSCSLHFFPELVKSDTPADYGMPLGRLKEFHDLGLATPVRWYSDQPGHLKADGVSGSAEKGAAHVRDRIDRLVKQIRLIKKDDTPMELYREFHKRAAAPRIQ